MGILWAHKGTHYRVYRVKQCHDIEATVHKISELKDLYKERSCLYNNMSLIT